MRQLFPQPVVIPVATLDNPELGTQFAHSLQRGGLDSIEVTLRTSQALDVAQAISLECEDMKLGLGTVTRAEQLTAAKELGADFAVSPGLDEALVRTAQELDMPYLPGVSTPTECMRAASLGCQAVKVFPAGSLGGPSFLKQLAALFPQMAFCPTGGISPASLSEYLELPGVFAAGGSWLAPQDLISQGDWSALERLARDAAQICTNTGPATDTQTH